MLREIDLELRHVAGGGGQPTQALTQIRVRLVGQRRQGGELAQAVDAVLPGFLVIGQQLGIGELGRQVLRVGAQDPGQAGARVAPILGGVRLRLVELGGQRRRRRVGLERPAIGGDRLGRLAVAFARPVRAAASSTGSTGPVASTCCRPGRSRGSSGRAAFSRATAAAAVATSPASNAACACIGQRVGVVRVEHQHAGQRLVGLVLLVLAAPVDRLVQQHPDGVGGAGGALRRVRLRQRRQRHGWRRPPAAGRTARDAVHGWRAPQPGGSRRARRAARLRSRDVSRTPPATRCPAPSAPRCRAGSRAAARTGRSRTATSPLLYSAPTR